MPIKFNCEKCNKAFTVADSAAGKSGRCNECGNLNRIPKSTAKSTAKSAAKSPLAKASVKTAAKFEVMSGVDGSVFGPADKATLKQWAMEDRITPNCKIKKVGTEKWTAASRVFPSLAAAVPTEAASVNDPIVASDDPFAKFKSGQASGAVAGGGSGASSSVNPYVSSTVSKQPTGATGNFEPTSGDIGFILNHAFGTFGRKWGILVGGFLISGLSYIGFIIVVSALAAVGGAAVEAIGGILNIFVSTFFTAGFLGLLLKVGRGESAVLKDCFAAGDRVLPLIGYGLLAMIIFLVPFAIIGGIVYALALAGGNAGAGGGAGAGVGVAGIILVMVISLLAGLLLWPGYFLIVDRKATVIEAFSLAYAIGKKNILQFIAVYFISVIIGWIGILLFGVGLIFTGPLAMLIVVCAYLNMSGQIRA